MLSKTSLFAAATALAGTAYAQLDFLDGVEDVQPKFPNSHEVEYKDLSKKMNDIATYVFELGEFRTIIVKDVPFNYEYISKEEAEKRRKDKEVHEELGPVVDDGSFSDEDSDYESEDQIGTQESVDYDPNTQKKDDADDANDAEEAEKVEDADVDLNNLFDSDEDSERIQVLRNLREGDVPKRKAVSKKDKSKDKKSKEKGVLTRAAVDLILTSDVDGLMDPDDDVEELMRSVRGSAEIDLKDYYGLVRSDLQTKLAIRTKGCFVLPIHNHIPLHSARIEASEIVKVTVRLLEFLGCPHVTVIPPTSLSIEDAPSETEVNPLVSHLLLAPLEELTLSHIIKAEIYGASQSRIDLLKRSFFEKMMEKIMDLINNKEKDAEGKDGADGDSDGNDGNDGADDKKAVEGDDDIADGIMDSPDDFVAELKRMINKEEDDANAGDTSDEDDDSTATESEEEIFVTRDLGFAEFDVDAQIKTLLNGSTFVGKLNDTGKPRGRKLAEKSTDAQYLISLSEKLFDTEYSKLMKRHREYQATHETSSVKIHDWKMYSKLGDADDDLGIKSSEMTKVVNPNEIKRQMIDNNAVIERVASLDYDTPFQGSNLIPDATFGFSNFCNQAISFQQLTVGLLNEIVDDQCGAEYPEDSIVGSCMKISSDLLLPECFQLVFESIIEKGTPTTRDIVAMYTTFFGHAMKRTCGVSRLLKSYGLSTYSYSPDPMDGDFNRLTMEYVCRMSTLSHPYRVLDRYDSPSSGFTKYFNWPLFGSHRKVIEPMKSLDDSMRPLFFRNFDPISNPTSYRYTSKYSVAIAVRPIEGGELAYGGSLVVRQKTEFEEEATRDDLEEILEGAKKKSKTPGVLDEDDDEPFTPNQLLFMFQIVDIMPDGTTRKRMIVNPDAHRPDADVKDIDIKKKGKKEKDGSGEKDDEKANKPVASQCVVKLLPMARTQKAFARSPAKSAVIDVATKTCKLLGAKIVQLDDVTEVSCKDPSRKYNPDIIFSIFNSMTAANKLGFWPALSVRMAESVCSVYQKLNDFSLENLKGLAHGTCKVPNTPDFDFLDECPESISFSDCVRHLYKQALLDNSSTEISEALCQLYSQVTDVVTAFEHAGKDCPLRRVSRLFTKKDLERIRADIGPAETALYGGDICRTTLGFQHD